MSTDPCFVQLRLADTQYGKGVLSPVKTSENRSTISWVIDLVWCNELSTSGKAVLVLVPPQGHQLKLSSSVFLIPFRRCFLRTLFLVIQLKSRGTTSKLCCGNTIITLEWPEFMFSLWVLPSASRAVASLYVSGCCMESKPLSLVFVRESKGDCKVLEICLYPVLPLDMLWELNKQKESSIIIVTLGRLSRILGNWISDLG